MKALNQSREMFETQDEIFILIGMCVVLLVVGMFLMFGGNGSADEHEELKEENIADGSTPRASVSA